MNLWQWKVMFQEGKGLEDGIKTWLEELALKGAEEEED